MSAKSTWRPMSSAPRDGTIILVCETGNGEQVNVMPAAYMNCMGSMQGFWGVWTSSLLPTHMIRQQDAADAVGLPVDWRAIAMTPVCWMPMPEPESLKKANKRLSQILRIPRDQR